MFTHLNAFNLTPGAAFNTNPDLSQVPPQTTGDQSVWVAMNVDRDANREAVYVYARRADEVRESPAEKIETQAFTFDYCDKVNLVGIVLYPTDPDDNDWGQ